MTQELHPDVLHPSGTRPVGGHLRDPGRTRGARRWIKERHPAFIAALLLMMGWEIGRYFGNDLMFPPLVEIGRTLIELVTDWSAMRHLVATAIRVLAAVLMAFVVGLGIGLLMGRVGVVRKYAKPLLHFIQGVPALSWVVFAVLWFQNPETRIAFILVAVTMPAFALYIDSAVRAVPREWIELCQAFRGSDKAILRTVILPAITPEILSSWQVNLGNAVRAGVVAELIGATLGVGFQLLRSQSLFNMAAAVSWTLLLVALLLVYQAVVTAVERYLLAWRPTGERDRA